MNREKLKEFGLDPVQINQVMGEFNKTNEGRVNFNTTESYEKQQKRKEIMAVKDIKERQRLIEENRDLFK